MFEKIKLAQKRLERIAHRTPVLTSTTLNKIVRASVFLKCENFQRAGAFKFRGAYNAISKLTDAEKQKGVITYSSGNHAQAVALVGNLLNVKTVVVMPQNSPIIKRAATLDYGAEIILYNPEVSIREEVAKELIEKHGYNLIPPFDHYDIIAGQGTAALELFEEVGKLDYVLAPCGGGGLLSGTAIASKGMNPNCYLIGVEPELADDATRSFYSKTLHSVKNPTTIADGTRTTSLGKITFPLVLEYVDEMKTVSEEEIIDSVKFLFYRLKLVVEPSGALGIAALLGSKVSVSGRVGVIISGGNIDGVTMKMILDS
jgi:threonine dehydratase